MSEEKVTVSSTEQGHTSKKQNNKTLIVLLVIIIVLLVAVVALLLKRPAQDERETYTDGRATFVSQDNVNEVLDELNEPVEDAYYMTSMTIDWNFNDGSSASSNAYVENAVENKRTVYFDVHLETGELVYSSPYLPVGETITGIQLDKVLEKGDYPAIITYHLVDDDHQEITSVSVAITIHILN